ncbi:TetR/AcrR family transcriptional regulator [Amycolatopsis anabasis]|uniref:TetR/AcrR family transcriptional regulator n=1 Tax=Amycolatopsis anabasis TaxID=1840409 RepID=UPI00131BEE98|nr:TetR/AcrR family transcriptional regulator [Amycolatopsis anabasis]
MSSSAPVRTAYHHGDLRNALIAAAAELAQSGGPASVTIRAAAKTVGVTPTAAYRHFAGHEELLAAAKERALELLAESMNAELARLPEIADPVLRALVNLAAIGRGYLNFADAEPGLFRTCFAHGMAMSPSPRRARENKPFLRLNEAMDDLVAAGYLPAERRPMAEVTVWSVVHGLATLYLDGPLRAAEEGARDQALERSVEIITVGLGGAPLPAEFAAMLQASLRPPEGERS